MRLGPIFETAGDDDDGTNSSIYFRVYMNNTRGQDAYYKSKSAILKRHI